MGPRPLRPWKSTCRPSRQMPHVESASMGPRPLRPWKSVATSTAADRQIGFNGATAVEPWKCAVATLARRAVGASMGPRPLSRGNACREPDVAALVGFNGATAVQPWKCASTQSLEPSLDDAASMGPRPLSRGNDDASATS